ncbi:MAG TPA: BatD family protein, partial [Thermoanaerobaculia bacterium]|nr:BatD family protein [Thermoanaerobaculia bacterium]
MRRAAAALALLLLAAAGRAEDPPVQVRLEPPVVGVGEAAELSFQLSLGVRSGRFEPRFQLDNLVVAGGPSRSETLTWIHGDLTRRVTLSWLLVPDDVGVGRVYDIRVAVDDRLLTFPDREVRVEAEPQRPPQRLGRRARPDDPFDLLFRGVLPRRSRPRPHDRPQLLLQAEVEPRRPYVGQQALYTLYLLAERRRVGEGRVSVETIFPRRLPQFRGFWSQEVPLPEHLQPEVVQQEGRFYWRQPVLRRALFPFRAGEQEIEGAEAELRAVFFEPTPFGEEPVRPAPIRRESAPLRLDVRSLPDPPASFSGAVGSFAVDAALEPPAVAAGDAATLTLTLRGTGQLSGLPDPPPPELPGIRVLPPHEATDHQLRGQEILASRSWRYTLVPEGAGRWTVPPVRWTTFHPGSGEYEELASPPLALAVAPPAAAAESGAAAPPAALAAPAEGWLARYPQWRWAALGLGATVLLLLAAAVVWRSAGVPATHGAAADGGAPSRGGQGGSRKADD